jgi:hypothetical protein
MLLQKTHIAALYRSCATGLYCTSELSLATGYTSISSEMDQPYITQQQIWQLQQQHLALLYQYQKYFQQLCPSAVPHQQYKMRDATYETVLPGSQHWHEQTQQHREQPQSFPTLVTLADDIARLGQRQAKEASYQREHNALRVGSLEEMRQQQEQRFQQVLRKQEQIGQLVEGLSKDQKQLVEDFRESRKYFPSLASPQSGQNRDSLP